jgi:LysR family glycine cleavage system transcriptional activator
MPRLPELLADTGIELELTVSRDPELLRGQMVDMALWGGPTRPTTLVDIVAELDAVPVAARRLADGRHPPATLAALARHHLIEVRSSAGLWQHWLNRAGYRGPEPAISARYETNQLKDEAAASGQGVTLAVPLVSQRFLAADRLISCTRLRLPIGQSYCLHYASADVRSRPKVRDFAAWLKIEAAESLRQFDQWHHAGP